MTKLKWTYVAKGHYSAKDGDWTIHVLDNGTVYKTHPSRATTDVTGAKADGYAESAQTKFPVRGKRRAEPAREPAKERSTKLPPPTKTKRVTKKQISAAAKKLAKGAGSIIGTTRAFVTEIGEAEELTYAKRKAPPPTKTAKPKKKVKTKKKVKPPSSGRPTIVRKKKVKPPARRAAESDHPLQYLIGGGEALLPTRRRARGAPRGQTLEEYLGY